MRLRTFIVYLALAAALTVVIALIPPTPTVSYAEFVCISGSIFAAFFVLSLVAKIGPRKALMFATIFSCITLFTGAVASIIIRSTRACL